MDYQDLITKTFSTDQIVQYICANKSYSLSKLSKNALANLISKDFYSDAFINLWLSEKIPFEFSKNGRSFSLPFQLAKTQNLKGLRLLKKEGFDLTRPDKNGYNLLIPFLLTNSKDELALLAKLKDLLDLFPTLNLNSESKYGETAAKIAAREGRFQILQHLKNSGARLGNLSWSVLHESVAWGNVSDIALIVERNPELCSEKDCWDRSPFLLAVQSGSTEKVEFLFDLKTSHQDKGICGLTPISLATKNNDMAMFELLVSKGFSVNDQDDFGRTPLQYAVEADHIDLVHKLLMACDKPKQSRLRKIVESAKSLAVFQTLVNHWNLTFALPDRLRIMERNKYVIEPTELVDSLNKRDPVRIFGIHNPEDSTSSWKKFAISGDIDPFYLVKENTDEVHPVWTANRMGASISLLPNGTKVEIGGEHEDSYDPNFCIYNDVFVHHFNGDIQVFDYPREIFRPTDFHSATLIGNYIYIIGGIGYPEDRLEGFTPVYMLDLNSFSISKISSRGNCPGWISDHSAELISKSKILIKNGNVLVGGKFIENQNSFIFDTKRCSWRVFDQ